MPGTTHKKTTPKCRNKTLKTTGSSKQNPDSTTTKFISKAEYQKWETGLTKLWGSHAKRLLGYPTAKLMDKNKIIVVLDITLPGNIHNQVSLSTFNNPNDIPENKLTLWHIGSQKMDTVKYGFNAEKQILNYPAFDFGGLTNYKQQVGQGKKPDFIGNNTEIIYSSPSTANVIAANIFKEWCKLLGGLKMTPADTHKIQLGISKVLLSITPANLPVNIRFSKLPSERRLIIPAAEVFSKTGQYYLRNYGNKSDDDFAKQITNKTELANLFMGISKEYITPNLNKFNIDYEYTINRSHTRTHKKLSSGTRTS